jgi:hypothetical protein
MSAVAIGFANGYSRPNWCGINNIIGGHKLQQEHKWTPVPKAILRGLSEASDCSALWRFHISDLAGLRSAPAFKGWGGAATAFGKNRQEKIGRILVQFEVAGERLENHGVIQ